MKRGGTLTLQSKHKKLTKKLVKIAMVHLLIIFILFGSLSLASRYIVGSFSQDYYNELLTSTSDRFSNKFNDIVLELTQLADHVDQLPGFYSQERTERREVILDVIDTSQFIDYGLLINDQNIIESSVFKGEVRASEINTDRKLTVTTPVIQQATLIRNANLLEFIIPLTESNDQLHLFMDLTQNQMVQQLFSSISFADELFVSIVQNDNDVVFSYHHNMEEDLGPLLQETRLSDAYQVMRNQPTSFEFNNFNYSYYYQDLAIDNWSLLLIVPEELPAYFESRMISVLIPIFFVIGLILFFIITYLTYRNQKPYEKLEEAIESISEGNYHHRIDTINPNLRLAPINQKFNHMAQLIEAFSLEVDNKEYTLQNQKAFLDRVINSNPALIYTMQADGIYTLVNESYAALYDKQPEEIIGTSVFDLFDDQKRAHYELKLNVSIMKANKDLLYDESINHKGEVLYYTISKQTIRGLDSQQSEVLMVATDVTEQKVQQQQIEYQAYHDDLTKIGNRKYFKKQIQTFMHTADQTNQCFAVMFLDLDRFKYVNDTFGHDAGDKLLVEVAKRIRNILNTHDEVFRFGGDEFTLLVYYNQDRSVITDKAKQIIEELTTPYHFSGHTFIITASIGISLYPKQSQDTNELTKYADLSMYQAKQQGKNTFRFYTPELLTAVSQNIRLETDIFQAIARNELRVRYQPIFNKDTQALIGLEALLRWEHQKLGIIPPQTFMSIAEATGVIDAFTQLVIDEGTNILQKLKKRHPNLKLHLNLSEHQLTTSLTANMLHKAIKQEHLNPSDVVLEINEAIFAQAGMTLVDMLNQLQRTGYKLAVDNFGDHYLSLSQLNKLPIDQIKLSRNSLYQATEGEEVKQAFYQMIQLADQLNLDIIQEGIESEEQADFMRDLPIIGWQGFLFSQPITEEQFEQLY